MVSTLLNAIHAVLRKDRVLFMVIIGNIVVWMVVLGLGRYMWNNRNKGEINTKEFQKKEKIVIKGNKTMGTLMTICAIAYLLLLLFSRNDYFAAVVFLIFFLFTLIPFSALNIWYVIIDGSNVCYRNYIGIKKLYTSQDISEIIVKPNYSIVVKGKNKKLFTVDNFFPNGMDVVFWARERNINVVFQEKRNKNETTDMYRIQHSLVQNIIANSASVILLAVSFLCIYDNPKLSLLSFCIFGPVAIFIFFDSFPKVYVDKGVIRSRYFGIFFKDCTFYDIKSIKETTKTFKVYLKDNHKLCEFQKDDINAKKFIDKARTIAGIRIVR